jgi:ribosomal-protein-alanine N-acetyltransferase
MMSDFDRLTDECWLPQLQTDRLLLRPFRVEDCRQLEILLQDAQIRANTNVNFADESTVEEWVDNLTTVWQQGRGVAFAISLREQDSRSLNSLNQNSPGSTGGIPSDPLVNNRGLIGGIGLELDPKNQSGELGFWIGREYRRRGFATEAALAVVKYGFQKLSLNKITASHLEINPVSGRILREVGLEVEGVLRKQIRRAGVFYDLICYGILARNFPSR